MLFSQGQADIDCFLQCRGWELSGWVSDGICSPARSAQGICDIRADHRPLGHGSVRFSDLMVFCLVRRIERAHVRTAQKLFLSLGYSYYAEVACSCGRSRAASCTDTAGRRRIWGFRLLATKSAVFPVVGCSSVSCPMRSFRTSFP